MNRGERHEGGCTCGFVRFELQGPPMVVHCCHCTWCQRETGSAFAVNALIESDRVKLESGEVELVQTPSASGGGQRIARCPRCRVAVWSHYAFGSIGELVRFVRVGTLVRAAELTPDVHIFTSSRAPWLVLDPEIPAFDAYYSASKVWSSESLERRSALHAQSSAPE